MATASKSKRVPPEQRERFLSILQARFEKNRHRHVGLAWTGVLTRLQRDERKLWSLLQMEETGGAPDVVAFDKVTEAYLFCDCSPESPAGRRSLCYDREGLESRKDHPPAGTALDLATKMGIKILSEDEYRALQQLDHFDAKTSSWIETPAGIRKLGGALFCDFRYGNVFVYHNGAGSYYSARGFRGSLLV